jgi:anaerobic nitric oxide reductase transcription regulator
MNPWGLLTLDALDPNASNRSNWMPCKPSPASPPPRSTWPNASSAWPCAPNEHQRAEVYRQASGQQHKEMIGQSKPHKRLVEEINLVGGSDLTVLITGETGVGKELVAQAIHAASPAPTNR